MAAFTITTPTNIDALTGKAGGDTYAVNGSTLTIDQDSRVGLNQTTSTTLGSITISAALGGICNIDGSAIWMIPYTGGSGNVPAWNTTITNGSGTGKLIGVHASLTAASTATGAAMPASGFIRVKQKSGTYSAGALTGITATASDAGRVGWLEIVGDEASTVNANRLGQFNITGAWYEVGTTSGTSNQTMQIPNNVLLRYAAGVFIEKYAPRAATYTWTTNTITVTLANHGFEIGDSIELAFTTGGVTTNGSYKVVMVWGTGSFDVLLTGSGASGNCTATIMEFYGNAGTTTTTGTEAARGKLVWIDANGLVRIGNSGAATNGYTPVAGLKVVIGNVFLENCTTAARTANVIPNATVATRYDFTTTGGGVLAIDKCNMGWYLSCTQAYSLTISNSCFVDAVYIAETATPMLWANVGVGNKPTTALLVSGLQMLYCFAGGVFNNCIFNRVSLAASGAYTTVMQDITGFNFNNCTIRANTIKGNAAVYSIFGTRMKQCNFKNFTMIGGDVALVTCDGVTGIGTSYIIGVSGTTVTTYATYVWNLSANTINCVFAGLSFPVTNNQPYTAIMAQATGCANNKLRLIGTELAPLDMGTVNACGLIHTLATGCFDTKIQQVYCMNTRTGIMTGDNSSKGLVHENVWGDYADAVDVSAVINFTNKGMRGTGALTAQVSVYGTHWRDGFTSTTAGRIAILMNEATAETASQVTLANGSAFTSAGGLYMPVIGHTVTFEMPEYIIGHTAFANSALVMAGGTATNYTYEYAIDKNDGAGWSAMTTANYTATTLGTALSGITGINAQLGFKLRLKITTGTTNATAITSVYVTTVSTTTAQGYKYPLDTATISVDGMVTGSRMKATKTSDGTVLFNGAESGGIASFNTEYIGAIDIEVRKASEVPYYIAWVTRVVSVSGQTVSATALQQLD